MAASSDDYPPPTRSSNLAHDDLMKRSIQMANTSAIYVAGFLPSFLIDSIHVATILSSPMPVFRIQVVRGRLRAITVNEDVSRR